MVTGIRTIVRRLLLLALLASAGVGWSDRASAQARAMPGTDWVPVDPALLDDLRGGFQLPSGLLVSFGIARVAWVNGELVSYLRVDIPDVARMTPAEAERSEEHTSELQSLMRISYAVFCLQKKTKNKRNTQPK